MLLAKAQHVLALIPKIHSESVTISVFDHQQYHGRIKGFSDVPTVPLCSICLPKLIVVFVSNFKGLAALHNYPLLIKLLFQVRNMFCVYRH